MTRIQLISELRKRRNDASEERTRAYKAGHVEAYNNAFGRVQEIDAIIDILRTNLINGH